MMRSEVRKSPDHVHIVACRSACWVLIRMTASKGYGFHCPYPIASGVPVGGCGFKCM
jgi:hypothetical protein